ncbi:MAG: lamin tail domain-containing protein [Candidatus Moraniibacteriota bacterium]
MASTEIVINEIMLGTEADSKEEFIELFNPGLQSISLKNFKLTKKTNSKDNLITTESTLITSSNFQGEIPAGGYFLITHLNFKLKFFADLSYPSSYYITDDNTILLYDSEGKLIDKVGIGKALDFEAEATQNPPKGASVERNENHLDTDNNFKDFSPQNKPSPTNSSGENSEESDDSKGDTEEDEKESHAGKIKINEVYPSPNTKLGEKEFIEIRNTSTEKINLKNWSASDSIHEGKTTIDTDLFLESNDLYAFEGNFYLNTPSDTARVFDENKVEVDSLLYDKAKSAYAYAFDGSNWQWTSKVTKDAENEFDELLAGEIKKDKTIYAGVYANFEAKTNSKAKKFNWNFGDSHTSSLKKTRHKYEKAGTYDASLKITGDGKENLIGFTVEVEKFGKAKMKITGLSANPKGSDSDNEWLEIFNNTKKKIDLKGWSVATGWKNLYNHPITKKFILKAGETKKLTREFCAFALGNKQAKIELRYPDGKVADKIKYNRKDNSISEDELYQKTTAGWDWTTPEKEPTSTNEESEKPVAPISETLPEEKPEEINVDIDLSLLGKYSENPAWQQKQKKQIALVFAGSNVSPPKILAQNQGRVLGISTVKTTPEKTLESTFSLNLIWKKINAQLNELILML